MPDDRTLEDLSTQPWIDEEPPVAVESRTWKQKCEQIAASILEIHGVEVAWEAIWNVDPHGEMWPVFGLYEMYVERSGYDSSLVRYVKKLLDGGKNVAAKDEA